MLLLGLMVAALIAVVFRLWQVQIVDHEEYVRQAARTRNGIAETTAPRGTITDSTGYPLAMSRDTWDVYLDTYLWRERDKARESAFSLSQLLGVDAARTFTLGTAQSRGDVPLLRHLAYETGQTIRKEHLWGVRVLPSAERVYPEGALASPLIGYTGASGEGLWGVELDYDQVLRGHGGIVLSERDPLGRPIAFAPRVEHTAQVGGNIQLTIDRHIQRIAEQRLDEALKDTKAPSGSVLVMDPKTGALLAVASRPAAVSMENLLDHPKLSQLVRDRPITDLYEPGSVMKTLTTAAAIDMGVITPATTYIDTGRFDIPGTDYVIKNWDLQKHGQVTMTEYLQRSLNTGSVWISSKLGARNFYRYIGAFGLTEFTHVGLGEAKGIIRTPDDDDWYPVDLATNSYGQGLAVTPLQVLTAVSSLANGGVLMRPYVVSRVVSDDEVRTYEPVQVRRVISEESARTVMRMMYEVVEGTVEGVPPHRARVPGYAIAGKTGTTLVSIPTGYDLDTTIASFVGFAPYENPRVAILVKIDQPAGARNLGGEVAAPAFAKMTRDIMQYLQIPPSRPTAQVAAR
ncbi:MAG: penicillin-binding protein 2 [Dehalococcoidia bacterium]|nr:penicillin-binding protein 2 [Dehalococcoidia bacterium]